MALPADLLALKAECKRRFRAKGPFEMQICLSHERRRHTNELANKGRAGLEVECEDMANGVFACYVSLLLVGISGARHLIVGMQYVVQAVGKLVTLEEVELRAGREEKLQIEICPHLLGKEATLANCVTNAGCQGKTCRKKLRVLDVDNPYMGVEQLYVAISRASDPANVCVQ